MGYAVDFAQRPQGFILLVIIPATIIVYEELRSLKREVGKKTKYSRFRLRKIKGGKGHEINFLYTKDKAGLPKVTVILPILGSLIVLVGVAGSFFSDLEISSGSIINISTSPPPSPEITVEPIVQELVLSETTTETSSPTPTPTPSPTSTSSPTSTPGP